MRLVSIYGSPTTPGKLARAMSIAEDRVRQHDGWEVRRLTSQPTDNPVVGLWSASDVDAVAGADAVLVASPVFRASIPGTLKLLFDMLPNEALRNKPVAILTIGAAPHHFLAAERHLRDLLAWFGALGAPNAAYFVDSTFKDDVPQEAKDELAELVDQVVNLAERLSGLTFGPDPLTVRYARGQRN
ncbi:hypothetical protein TBS_06360 [Thermobispora bispora]|uniref:NADPH-dependent FMN reductase n=1 Tax=Thermobispora bispora TaxID=2006 RepID=UPI0030E8B843